MKREIKRLNAAASRFAAGFTLTEIMVVVAIIGLLTAMFVIPKVAAMKTSADTTTLSSFQSSVESAYGRWTAGGGAHNAAGATQALQASMAADILQILNGNQGANLVPTNTATTGVVESNAAQSMPSNLVRVTFKTAPSSTATYAQVGPYYLLFKPLSTSTGVWQVTKTVPSAAIP